MTGCFEIQYTLILIHTLTLCPNQHDATKHQVTVTSVPPPTANDVQQDILPVT